MKRTNKNIKQNIFMISLIIIEVTQKIRIMENIMNRIFQKFLQSVIDLSSVGAKCLKDNTPSLYMITAQGHSSSLQTSSKNLML